MRDFLSGLFFGGVCFLCRGPARGILCGDCRSELPYLHGALCPRCALPSPGAAVCGRCLAEPPQYDGTVAALAYEFPADALVHALKFRGELALASFLGREIARRISAVEIDSVVPVPLSAARLRTRGYNHAAEIARHLLPGKLDLALCERSRDTPPQMDLPFAERRRNVRGAFRCTRALMGASIAVVDDVMTTGATLNELARTLKDAGAARVVNLVVARTFPPD